MTIALPAPVAAYVHVPFCERKCLYCDFNSGVHGPDTRASYVEAVIAEIAASPYRGSVSSVFFGGGTPSVLPAASLTSMLDALRDHFEVSPDAEITVECNPGTLAAERMTGETTAGFLSGLRAAGVNRLSFGVQSLDSGLLSRLGRIHSPDQALESVALARAAGFENINVDLMFALPGQTREAWRRTLAAVLDLGLPHLSCYSLIVEPGTPFHEWDAAGALPRPDEDAEAAMYEECIASLREAGYEHYEVSAFARPGFRCRHNEVYWRNDEYVAFGNGATSYIAGERFTREASLESYMQKALAASDTVSERERLGPLETMGETMMMGLRRLEGVDRCDFQARFGTDIAAVWPEQLRNLTEAGLIRVTPRRVALTHRGLLLANEVWEAFVAA